MTTRTEAEAECSRCRGRQCEDCGLDQCRFWRLTATADEAFELAFALGLVKLPKRRHGVGPQKRRMKRDCA